VLTWIASLILVVVVTAAIAAKLLLRRGGWPEGCRPRWRCAVQPAGSNGPPHTRFAHTPQRPL